MFYLWKKQSTFKRTNLKQFKCTVTFLENIQIRFLTGKKRSTNSSKTHLTETYKSEHTHRMNHFHAKIQLLFSPK